ncbi:MAG: hypothetical protein Q9180_004866, partial [Flavoplaca navasiana]
MAGMAFKYCFIACLTLLALRTIPFASTTSLEVAPTDVRSGQLVSRAFGLPPPPLPDDSSEVTASPDDVATIDTADGDTQAAEKPLRYLILPATRSSKEDTDKVYTDLVSKAKDTHPLFSKSDDDLGVIFWTALLVPSDADQLKRDHPILTSVAEDKAIRLEGFRDYSVIIEKRNLRRKRDEPKTIVKQPNPPDQLKVVSQPTKDNKVSDLKNFAYREEAGRGVTVYLFDEGANKVHSEWTTQPGTKRWFFPGDPNDPRYTIDRTENDRARDSHGSCVYSMAVGPRFGIAKNSDVVILKHAAFNSEDPDDEDEEDTVESATLDGMAIILADVKELKLQNKTVVNLSFGVTNALEVASREKFHDLVKELLANDVVVATASGNELMYKNPESEDRTDIDDYPALFRKDLTNMIVVGATNNEGKTWPESQRGDLLDLSAPGDEIACARREGNGLITHSGTSFATASVSGLAAYFLSLPELSERLKRRGKTAQNVKDLILEKAYSRIDGEIKVLYN